MGKTYERSLFSFGHYAPRSGPVPVDPPAGLPADTRTGDRCPRRGCGGLVLDRVVVTQDGVCEEVYCVACSRTRGVRLVEPYRPLPQAQDPQVEALCQPTPVGLKAEPLGEEAVEVPAAWKGIDFDGEVG